MNKAKILIIGSSGYAKVIIDIVEKMEQFEIIGLTDETRSPGETTLGYPVLGNEKALPQILKEHAPLSIAIAVGDNWTRHMIAQRIMQLRPDIDFPNIIHPSVQLAKDIKMGKGVVMMAGAIINSSTTIGHFTIINTKSSLDHDNSMGDFASIAPNATTGGNVTIGAFSAVGISATIKHGITIGEHSVIGASSFLNKNCESYTTMYGIPAKKISSRNKGEKYL